MLKPSVPVPSSWRLKGPQLLVEFCEVVTQSGGDLDVYFSSWAQTSGVSENSAAFHEARQLLEFLKAGLMIDQLDCSKCNWAERVARRYIEVQ